MNRYEEGYEDLLTRDIRVNPRTGYLKYPKNPEGNGISSGHTCPDRPNLPCEMCNAAKGGSQGMSSPRDLCCDIHSALCSALGYLELYFGGDVPPDKVREVLGRVEQQAKRALEAEMKLFKTIGCDKFPPSPSQHGSN